MAALQLVAILASRVSLLGESIHRSQSNTDGMVSILSSFGDHRLSALEVATQVRKQAIRMAYDNIDKMLKAVEVILAQFDLTQQADAKILRGPHEDLESYIEAMDQLRGVIQFFNSNKSFKMSDGVVKLCNNLLVKSIPKLEEEFKQILATYSKPVEPDDLFDGLGDGGNNSSTSNSFENQSKTLEAAVYKPPTLIPPRILPLLHDLAEQLIHAGNQVQSLKIYSRRTTLTQLFQEFETGDDFDSQLAAAIMSIMQALQSNLDGKSKQYKDPALAHLFLMNNIDCMVRFVLRSEAKDLLGDDWVQRHLRIVLQNANQYKRVAWSKILRAIDTHTVGLYSSGTDGSYGGVVLRETVKERFKSFNIQFEELHQRQSQWTVPDPELRESLRLAVAQVLLPAYRTFLGRFGWLVRDSKNLQKYIRYIPEDLDRMLGEFFEGNTWNESKR